VREAPAGLTQFESKSADGKGPRLGPRFREVARRLMPALSIWVAEPRPLEFEAN